MFIQTILFVITSLFSITLIADSHKPLIITLSNPRSMTTALERSFVERGDVEVIHEPWSCLYWTLHKKGSLETAIPDFIASAHDFYELRNRLLLKSKEKMLFVKDFAFTTYPMILQDPQFLSDKNVKFIFLIREPKALIASYYKMLPQFEEYCVDFKALYEIYLEVWKHQGKQPIVVDADDLAMNPEKTLIYICEKLEIPFTSKMLHWEPGMLEIWKCYSKWHQDAAGSSGFFSQKPSEDPFEHFPDQDKARLMMIYEQNLPHYQALYHYRG